MYRALVVVFSVLLFSTPAVVNSDVYKWKDKNGVVQFSDRPGKQGAEKIKVKSTATPPAISEERKDKRRKVTSALKHDRIVKEKQKERLKKQKEEQAKNCATLKKRMQTYKDAPYLYEKDNKGVKRVLSFEEREKAVSTTEKEMKKWCK